MGADLCFANPGTSEMHFVSALDRSALDRVEGMCSVLFLFEGGATGAADGYGRMADRPASLTAFAFASETSSKELP